MIYYLPYTPEKTNYNVKNMPLIYGVVRCVADRVRWASPVRPSLSTEKITPKNYDI